MRCLFIYKEEFPWDVRVEKIINGLIGAGHEVVLVCRNLAQAPVEERFNEFTIRRLPRTKWLPGFFRKALNVALWFNPIWLVTILRAVVAFRPQLIIVRDLPLVAAGVIAARFSRSRVIFDMAECYPEMYRSARQFEQARQAVDFIKSPWLAERYERSAVKAVDHIFVMIDESRDRLLRIGVDSAKVTIVSNTPPLARIPARPRVHEGQDLRIIYVGFITRLRGLDYLICGVREFLSSAAKAQISLDIVGKGEASHELLALVKKLHLESHVRIHGWLPQSTVSELFSQSNVGALTYRICSHWNHTIPNKIFDYMAAGLPVLATAVEPIERILRANDCGLVCRGDDPSDVAKSLSKLMDPSLRQRLGNNGHEAVRGQYNWEADERRMVQVLDRLGSVEPRS